MSSDNVRRDAAESPASGSPSDDDKQSFPFEERLKNSGAILLEIQDRFCHRLSRLQAAEARLWRAASAHRKTSARHRACLIERERKRIGHHLHTGVGQLLAAIRIHGEVLQRQLPDAPEPVQKSLQRLNALVTETMEEVRGLSRSMYLPEWTRLPLAAALQRLYENSGAMERFVVSADIAPLLLEPGPRTKAVVYRATQEALANIIRHGRATRVSLALRAEQGAIELIVEDDGIGFDVAQVFENPKHSAAGIGLRALKEDAADVGGRLIIRSGPRGTMLKLIVPADNERSPV